MIHRLLTAKRSVIKSFMICFTVKTIFIYWYISSVKPTPKILKCAIWLHGVSFDHLECLCVQSLWILQSNFQLILGFTIYQNGSKRPSLDQNGPKRAEMDLRKYRNGLQRLPNWTRRAKYIQCRVGEHNMGLGRVGFIQLSIQLPTYRHAYLTI